MIAPPPRKPAMFFDERFMAAPHDEGFNEKTIFTCFLVCEGPLLLSNDDDFGVARGMVFQEICPGAGFKTGDFVK